MSSTESFRQRATQSLQTAREVATLTSWGIVYSGLGVFQITRFARDTFTEFPLGETITRHIGNWGPSVDLSLIMFPIELGKSYAARREWNRTYQVLDKVAPVAIMGLAYAANVWAEASTPNTGEKNLDTIAGVAAAAVTILTIRSTANQLRNN